MNIQKRPQMVSGTPHRVPTVTLASAWKQHHWWVKITKYRTFRGSVSDLGQGRATRKTAELEVTAESSAQTLDHRHLPPTSGLRGHFPGVLGFSLPTPVPASLTCSSHGPSCFPSAQDPTRPADFGDGPISPSL